MTGADLVDWYIWIGYGAEQYSFNEAVNILLYTCKMN